MQLVLAAVCALLAASAAAQDYPARPKSEVAKFQKIVNDAGIKPE